MRDDENAIRDLIANWQRATDAGDLPALLSLMAEDVVFLLPGQSPMRGRDAFATAFQAALQRVRISASSNIQEIYVTEDWAYCWNHLTVTVTPLDAAPAMRRTGYTLTILRRELGGGWVIARDANMLTPANSTAT
jgi:uncharacterized protein (TIGR02246 family)